MIICATDAEGVEHCRSLSEGVKGLCTLCGCVTMKLYTHSSSNAGGV